MDQHAWHAQQDKQHRGKVSHEGLIGAMVPRVSIDRARVLTHPHTHRTERRRVHDHWQRYSWRDAHPVRFPLAKVGGQEGGEERHHVPDRCGGARRQSGSGSSGSSSLAGGGSSGGSSSSRGSQGTWKGPTDHPTRTHHGMKPCLRRLLATHRESGGSFGATWVLTSHGMTFA